MRVSRVAVIADIHANIHALEVFMNYLNARPEIEMVLNLGDFLQLGPNPAEVFDVVMEDKRFINILGNNEIELIETLDKNEDVERVQHINWTKEKIGTHRLERLKKIPKSKMVDLYGKKVMMVHTVTEQYIQQDQFEQCEYVFMGHTHQQALGSYWKERRVMNPGSIGFTPKGIVNFAVIEIGGGMINFVFKNMRYDYSILQKELVSSDMPGSQKIMKYLIPPG
ncbi:phosphodiesterase [Clostridium sp. N3C]|uniref:metallophosphoesterase family protein n=1 Tax=Clostridium sp. N3C TaxID=1776758 RepID=UPI00092DED54|nr:metallophosphoesterase family protein [Clostridium sp. N3C]SCN23175.1 phosphodiesterase [Clostridium sp. N3C]